MDINASEVTNSEVILPLSRKNDDAFLMFLTACIPMAETLLGIETGCKDA